MIATLLSLALLAASSPDPVRLNLGQETALRCSAAFALIAYDQKRGAPGAGDWPVLGQRGSEYFVQTTAALMDQTGATREQVQTMFKARVDALQSESISAPDPKAAVRRVLMPCLTLLDAAVPPSR